MSQHSFATMAAFSLGWAAFMQFVCLGGNLYTQEDLKVMTEASSSAPGFPARGAVDGDRFSAEAGSAWKGGAGATNWWWQVHFFEPREVGTILQIVGDHPFVFRNAPKAYSWQSSDDGSAWHDLAETITSNEQRILRIHRLKTSHQVRYLRLHVQSCEGSVPAMREVEFYSGATANINFPDWVVVVNTTDRPELPSHGREFIPLVRRCQGWEHTQAQQVWLATFNKAFLDVEPRPLCAFLSGNFKDWCEVAHEPWRGVQEVLKRGNLPMWASCGGAQGLAILAENGVDKPWDCPHCRDPKNSKLPIYTHIGHTDSRPCGDYSGCVFERGSFNILQTVADPVFQGLPREFRAMESHCGQIEWPPKGWRLIATGGQGTQTRSQCLRVKDRFIYAAQFHIEMEGETETSKQIMSNFLNLTKARKKSFAAKERKEGVSARTSSEW